MVAIQPRAHGLAREWAKLTPTELLHLYGILTRVYAGAWERSHRMEIPYEVTDHLRAIAAEAQMESFYIMDALVDSTQELMNPPERYYSTYAMGGWTDGGRR